MREKEGEVKKVVSEMEALQGAVTQLRQQISTTEERIPRLEEAKKTAVTGIYSETSDKGPSEIGTTSLQRALVAAPC